MEAADGNVLDTPSVEGVSLGARGLCGLKVDARSEESGGLAPGAQLERVFAGPSVVTVPYVRLDPEWAFIWQDPRYEPLLRRYADPDVR